MSQTDNTEPIERVVKVVRVKANEQCTIRTLSDGRLEIVIVKRGGN